MINVRRTFTSLGLLLLAASVNATESEVTLAFNPQAGTWERDYRMIASVTIDGQPGTTSSVQSVRQQVIARAGDGWTLESIPDSTTVNGLESPLDRTIQEILLGQRFTYHLTAQGQLASISGFDALNAEVAARIPADSRAAVKQVINADTQRWRLAHQWQSECASLYGVALRDGQTLTQTDTLNPPNSFPLAFSETRTVSIAPETVTLTFTHEAVPVPDADLGQLSAYHVTETGTRSFDRSTGLPLEEEALRIVTVTVRTPTGPVEQVREETRRITYGPIAKP